LRVKKLWRRDLCLALLLAVGFACFIAGSALGHYQQRQHEKFLQYMTGGGVPISEVEELIEQNHKLIDTMKDIFVRLGLREK